MIWGHHHGFVWKLRGTPPHQVVHFTILLFDLVHLGYFPFLDTCISLVKGRKVLKKIPNPKHKTSSWMLATSRCLQENDHPAAFPTLLFSEVFDGATTAAAKTTQTRCFPPARPSQSIRTTSSTVFLLTNQMQIVSILVHETAQLQDIPFVESSPTFFLDVLLRWSEKLFVQLPVEETTTSHKTTKQTYRTIT